MSTLYNSFINSKEMGKMVDVGGPVVHCLDDGTGPPLLFLHGLGFSLFTFRANYPYFARSMRIVAPDLPGCGYSRLPGNYGCTPADMAKYMRSLLENLNIHSAAVCGAGEGGIYALELALRYPDIVNALVLVSPGSLTRHFPRRVRQLLNPWLGNLRIHAMGPKHIHDFLQWCYFNEVSISSYVVKQVYRPFENRMARNTLLRLLAEYDDRFVHEHLAEVKCPAFIVWGEGDNGRPCGMAEFYREEIPSALTCVIRNCGMLPHEEKSREFNEAVERFLLAAVPGLASGAEEPDDDASPTLR